MCWLLTALQLSLAILFSVRKIWHMQSRIHSWTPRIRSLFFDCEPCKLDSQPNKGHGENLYELLHGTGKSGVLLIPKVEDVCLEQKFGKFPRNGNACSRKTHITQLQDTIGGHEVDGMRERTQLVRQQSNLNGRRGNKRSIKVPLRAKYDSLSVKAGSSSFGSAGGAKNFFAGYCPILLAAARTLCDIASSSMKRNPEGKISLAKKPSQKAMKARKLKFTERTEELYAKSVSLCGSDKLARSINQIMPSKRPKLSSIDNKRGPDQFNCSRKERLDWSTPRSSRSSPSKIVKDSIARQSCIRPPHIRLKVSSSRQKLRKLLPVSWNRGRE